MIATVDSALASLGAIRGTKDWAPEWAVVESHLVVARETGDRTDLTAAHAVLVEGLRAVGLLVQETG